MAKFLPGDSVKVNIGGGMTGKVIRRCHLDNRCLWIDIPGDRPLRVQEDEIEEIKGESSETTDGKKASNSKE